MHLKEMSIEQLVIDIADPISTTYSGLVGEEILLRFNNLKQKVEEGQKVYEVIGWTHAYCCSKLDEGIDPREIEIPLMLEKAKEQLGLY